MAGIQFKIDIDMINPTLRLDFDPILPIKGALLLVDATHPFAPMASGVPAGNTKLPNLAWKQAVEVLGGSATQDDVNPIWRVAPFGATQPVVKRTPKGGIYTKGQYAGLFWPVALVDYLIANPSHALYVSLWHKRGMEAITNLSQLERNGEGTLTGTAYRMLTGQFLNGSSNTPTTNTVLGQAGFTTPNASGVYLASGAVSGTNLGGGNGQDFYSANGATLFGTYGNNGGAPRTSYRFYAEDLTVSGRTYAQVRAADEACFAREATAAGGRYAGDAAVED